MLNTEKEKRAIEYLKSFEPQSEPYYLCYSGGKDSDCIRILAALAGVKHDIVNNHTTVDAPETVRYIRSIPNVQINHPEKTMWQLIVEKGMPPTRLARYCCEELKEKGGKGRVKITGVRWAESAPRLERTGVVNFVGKPKTIQKEADKAGIEYRVNKAGSVVLNDDNDDNRRFVEHCYRTAVTMINPIVDWTDTEVWEFLRHYGCESNPLYKCGFKRIGCIGCPFGGKYSMLREFARYPKYKQLYIKAFDKMLEKRRAKGLETKLGCETGEDVFKWWIGDDPRQMEIFDMEHE